MIQIYLDYRIPIQYHALAKTPAKEQTGVCANHRTCIAWINAAALV